MARRVHTRHFRLLSRQRRLPAARRRDRRRRLRRSASPARRATRAFPRHAVAYCLRAGRHRRRGPRRTSASTTSRCSSSSASSRRTSASRRAGFRSFLMAGPLWIKEKLFTDRQLRTTLAATTATMLYAEHHESHAASAFFPSPFEEAAILTMDGVGEWATASIGVGAGNDIADPQRAALARFARPALLGVHLLHRVQGQLRRVQGDGARARTASRSTST